MKSQILCIVLLSSSVPAAAQRSDTTTLAPMVVSATKGPVDSSSVTQSVTVVSGNEVRARGVARVSDVLRLVPGAAVVQNGSTGSVSTLFLRGGESRYTKVLIDGVAVNAPGGFFDFSHLSTDNIERIEIVRGPASVVHGADAVSGVVQIITRQGRGPLAGSAEGRLGSRGGREAALEFAGSKNRTRYSLGGSARRTDGIHDFNNQYYNGTLSGSMGYSPSELVDLLLVTRYSAAEFHYPTDFTGAPVDSNSYRVQHRLTAGANANARISDRVAARLKVGTNEVSDLTEDIGVAFGSDELRQSALLSRTKRRNAELGFSLNTRAGTLSSGVEVMRESERSVNEEGPVGGQTAPSSSFRATRDVRSAYVELVGGSRLAAYTIAGRVDDNSDYSSHGTYSVGFSVAPWTAAKIRASLGTSFNAPAFNQLRPTLFTTGSPDLSPERARSWEVGIEQRLLDDAVTLSASHFRQSFRDMIQFVPGGPPSFLGSFDNLARAEANGYEVEGQVVPRSGVRLSAALTYVRPRVVSVNDSYAGELHPGDALIRRPERSGTLSISWVPAPATSLSVTTQYVGQRPDLDFTQFPSPVVTLPAYVRVDVGAARDLVRSGGTSLAGTLRVENLFGRKYEDVLHFAAPGRVALVGARVSARR